MLRNEMKNVFFILIFILERHSSHFLLLMDTMNCVSHKESGQKN